MTAIFVNQITDTVNTAAQVTATTVIAFVVTGRFDGRSIVDIEVSIDGTRYAPAHTFTKPDARSVTIEPNMYWRVAVKGVTSATPISVDANI